MALSQSSVYTGTDSGSFDVNLGNVGSIASDRFSKSSGSFGNPCQDVNNTVTPAFSDSVLSSHYQINSRQIHSVTRTPNVVNNVVKSNELGGLDSFETSKAYSFGGGKNLNNLTTMESHAADTGSFRCQTYIEEVSPDSPPETNNSWSWREHPCRPDNSPGTPSGMHGSPLSLADRVAQIALAERMSLSNFGYKSYTSGDIVPFRECPEYLLASRHNMPKNDNAPEYWSTSACHGDEICHITESQIYSIKNSHKFHLSGTESSYDRKNNNDVWLTSAGCSMNNSHYLPKTTTHMHCLSPKNANNTNGSSLKNGKNLHYTESLNLAGVGLGATGTKNTDAVETNPVNTATNTDEAASPKICVESLTPCHKTDKHTIKDCTESKSTSASRHESCHTSPSNNLDLTQVCQRSESEEVQELPGNACDNYYREMKALVSNVDEDRRGDTCTKLEIVSEKAATNYGDNDLRNESNSSSINKGSLEKGS
ncbi:hypothetical protein EGW08_018599, partial [Elysia chlorotica]